jgi:hypothetical protein
MTDLSDHPHFALLKSESYVSPNERAWLAWVKKAENLLGHSIDGDQDRDGYSLDFAYSFFEAGDTPQQYADEVREGSRR